MGELYKTITPSTDITRRSIIYKLENIFFKFSQDYKHVNYCCEVYFNIYRDWLAFEKSPKWHYCKWNIANRAWLALLEKLKTLCSSPFCLFRVLLHFPGVPCIYQTTAGITQLSQSMFLFIAIQLVWIICREVLEYIWCQRPFWTDTRVLYWL